MPLLYVIEDDSGIRHLLTIALENCGYTVKGFETAEEALLSMEQTPPDLCLFDIMLPGMDGVEAVDALGAGFDADSRDDAHRQRYGIG